jgi:hypothetical protein
MTGRLIVRADDDDDAFEDGPDRGRVLKRSSFSARCSTSTVDVRGFAGANAAG